MNEKDTRQNLKVTSEDYKKIQEGLAESNFTSNSEFTHFIAENISKVIALAPSASTDGNQISEGDGNPAAGGEENLAAWNGAAPAPGIAKESTSPDGSADGVFIHGKFIPTLFPDESWEAEDRQYYFDWIYDNIRQGLYYDLVNSFNGVRIWKTDHEGNPKEKTPYGYFTNKYLQWHTWPVYPELWPNLPSQEVIFPECQDPEYQKALRQRHHDPFANTELRHRDKHYM